jgi:hypothetical protein
MRTIRERTENPSERQRNAEAIVRDHASESMKIATEAVKRARLTQNKLFQEERPAVYQKIF